MRWFADATSAVSARDQRDARQGEDDLAQWRDYHTWLLSQRTLLAARRAADQPAFERSADHTQETAAQAAVARIPADTRALFAAVLAQERQQALAVLEAAAPAHAADPDAAEQQALATLIAQAAGEVATPETPTGYGWFPRGTPDDVRWYALDVTDLLTAPTAAAYQLADPPSDARRRILVALAAAGGLLIFLVVWFTLPRAPLTVQRLPAPRVTDAAAPNATPVAMALAIPSAARLRRSDGETRVVLSTTTAEDWPAPTDATPGYWHRGRFAPPTLCLDGALLSDLTGLVLVGGGGWPDRVYTVSDQAAGAALQLDACRGDARRYGVLAQTIAPAVAALGEAVALPGQPGVTVTVAAIALVGPDDDPTLPAGQARVVVAVRGPPGLDWPAYAPTLTTPDGQAYLPAEVAATPAGVELRYLVAQPAGALPVAWDLTHAGTVARWRATLD